MSPQDTLVAPVRDRPPVLGRYRLLERLGAGGFGEVWRARDELLHREVAVKRISLPPGGGRERAIREALAAARLSHPAIVALYEACEEDDAFYLISELVHGETLAQLIATGELSDEEILAIGVAVACALEHAHGCGVIHRDVKPQNVLVPRAPSQPAGAAKLTDFGGALLAGEDALTRTGDVLGTLAYMAPEQCEGRAVDEAADLYSLALVLYEAFSGVNPVRGANPAATARRIGRVLPPLGRYRGDLPRALTQSVDAALSPEPRDRGSLSGLRDVLQSPLEQSTRRPPTSRWLTLPRAVWLAGAMGLCAWQIGTGRPAVALLAVCAVLPVVVLARRPGPLWLAAGLAPVLGLAGLANAFPAIAGQAARWRARALLGALGYWWLRLAEPLLENPSNAMAAHSFAPLLSLGLPVGLAVWGVAAALLPWIVRGYNALLDTVAAVLWATLLAVAVLLTGPLLHRGLTIGQATPRDVLLGAALGAGLAVVARALRGPS